MRTLAQNSGGSPDPGVGAVRCSGGSPDPSVGSARGSGGSPDPAVGVHTPQAGRQTPVWEPRGTGAGPRGKSRESQEPVAVPAEVPKSARDGVP